jgi:hypothetical protein
VGSGMETPGARNTGKYNRVINIAVPGFAIYRGYISPFVKPGPLEYQLLKDHCTH